MNNEYFQHSDPIDFVINFAWACGCDRFIINNAKDELKNLKRTHADLANPVCWAKIDEEGNIVSTSTNPDSINYLVPLYIKK